MTRTLFDEKMNTDKGPYPLLWDWWLWVGADCLLTKMGENGVGVMFLCKQVFYMGNLIYSSL